MRVFVDQGASERRPTKASTSRALFLRAYFTTRVRDEDKAARKKQFALQPYGHLCALDDGFQVFSGKDEKSFGRIEFPSDGMREATAGLQHFRVGLANDPCLGRIRKNPSEPMPDPFAGGSLAILPGADERLFAHVTDTRVQLLIHRFASVLSSRASRSATSGR